MLRATRWICGSLILAGWLGTAALAPAQSKNDPPREVIDEAKLFKKDTIREANSEIAHIKRTYGKDVLIETRPEGVPNDEYKAWAAKRAKDFRIEGIYIVITLKPNKHLAVDLGEATRDSGDFTEADRKKTQQLLSEEFGKDRDKAILHALKNISIAFRNNTKPRIGAAPPVDRQPEPGGNPPQQAGQPGHGGWSFFGLGLGGFICLALVAVVVIWVVIGLIRSLTAPRYPVGGPGGGYGGGGGYGPGYGGYGGGGGGFFSSLLGGMFGAAAGMWMYNSFFGGHNYGGGPTTPTSSGFGGGGYYGGTANPSADPQPNDVASGYSGDGGADWGEDKDNAGGGDGGDGGGGDGGGGDWGGGDAGGGDAGGGGDWGGGDAGGGGGDWGGGGGGDFGGDGGGDW